MKKVKLYSKLINTEFDLSNSIHKLYLKELSEHKKVSKLIINPLDFELLIIECRKLFPITYNNSYDKVYLFGIELVKDYYCGFGCWYFK